MVLNLVVPMSICTPSEFCTCVDPLCRTHLKSFQSLGQSRLTLFEQRAHFSLAEKVLDFASVLLCFNKCEYLVESSV
jgi:hypothetical protein